MNVLVVGAGPAGLCFAAALKRSKPDTTIRVLERRPATESRGWGITFPARTLQELRDLVSIDHHPIETAEMRFQGRSHVPTPLEYCTLARDALVAGLRDKCTALGLSVEYESEVGRGAKIDFATYDVVVGADGVNSFVCASAKSTFRPSITHSDIRYVWLATPKLFGGCLPSIFRESDGGLFLAWAYQYNPNLSTFIVECTQATLEATGLGNLSTDDTCKKIARIFEDDLQGQPILSLGEIRWLQFPFVKCKSWVAGNLALVGDAAHTAHYSKGYGTELALHDALTLARSLAARPTVREGLMAYERERQPLVAKYQARAMSTHNWYARVMSEHARRGSEAVEAALREVEAHV